METRRPEDWTVQEVSTWLESLNLSQYIDSFLSMKIDGMLLFEMTDEDLQNDIDVPVRLHRFKILENIKKLKELAEQLPPSSDPAPDGGSNWEVLVLKAVEGELLNNTFLIGTSGASIGRNSSSNDIVISESFVSRRHCEVQFNEVANQFLITDLGSTTGTFVMVRTPTLVQKGMMFQMGLSEFKVNLVKYNPFGQAVELELAVYEGPARHTAICVNAEGLTLGRDPSNKYCIREDSQMSSYHAKIYLQNGQFFVEDVGSTNRTWVRLSSEALKSQPTAITVADVLKIGSTVFLVQLPEPADVAAFSSETKSVSEETACKICFSNECDTACYPCGHVFCYSCAYKCTVCPNCRRQVNELVKLYK